MFGWSSCGCSFCLSMERAYHLSPNEALEAYPPAPPPKKFGSLGLEPKWHCHFGIPRQRTQLYYVSILMMGCPWGFAGVDILRTSTKSPENSEPRLSQRTQFGDTCENICPSKLSKHEGLACWWLQSRGSPYAWDCGSCVALNSEALAVALSACGCCGSFLVLLVLFELVPHGDANRQGPVLAVWMLAANSQRLIWILLWISERSLSACFSREKAPKKIPPPKKSPKFQLKSICKPLELGGRSKTACLNVWITISEQRSNARASEYLCSLLLYVVHPLSRHLSWIYSRSGQTRQARLPITLLKCQPPLALIICSPLISGVEEVTWSSLKGVLKQGPFWLSNGHFCKQLSPLSHRTFQWENCLNKTHICLLKVPFRNPLLNWTGSVFPLLIICRTSQNIRAGSQAPLPHFEVCSVSIKSLMPKMFLLCPLSSSFAKTVPMSRSKTTNLHGTICVLHVSEVNWRCTGR